MCYITVVGPIMHFSIQRATDSKAVIFLTAYHKLKPFSFLLFVVVARSFWLTREKQFLGVCSFAKINVKIY